MLIKSLMKNNKSSPGMQMAKFLDGYAPIFTQFGRSIYASDVVQMCIDCIASECSKLTPQHITIDPNTGLSTILQGDNINRLFRFMPNPLMTTKQFLEKTIWLLFLNYNAFIYPTYNYQTDPTGKVIYDLNGVPKKTYTGFYPLNPIEVEFLEDPSGTLYVRFYFYNGQNYTLPYADIIHLRKKYSVNDIMGGGITGNPDNSALLTVLNTNDVILQGIAQVIPTTLKIRGILKMSTLMDDDKMTAERKAFEQKINDGESGVLPMDLKSDYTPLTINPTLIDAETMQFLENKVLRWFGVSLPILNGDYNNEQYQAFYNKTLQPIVIDLGQAFSGNLFRQREQDVGHQIRFYQLNLEYLDINSKIEFVKVVGDAGRLTDNQVLALFGMPPYPGGDIRKMSLNYINANLADLYQMMKVKGTLSNTQGGSE